EAVHGGAQDGAEQRGRQEVGEKNQRDRPGRVEALVGEDQQCHVGGSGAQRGLRVGDEETPRPALLPEKGEGGRHLTAALGSFEAVKAFERASAGSSKARPFPRAISSRKRATTPPPCRFGVVA